MDEGSIGTKRPASSAFLAGSFFRPSGVNSGATVSAEIPVGDRRTPTTVATGGTAHDPVGVGSATITATAPGLITQPNGAQTVTINP